MTAELDLFDTAAQTGASAILDPLTEHDALLRRFAEIHLERVRHLRTLADVAAADALPRARKRVDVLALETKLAAWYRVLKTALDAPADEDLARTLVRLMRHGLRGKDEGAIVEDSFVIALRDAHVSPQILAGAVKRAWLLFKSKPALPAFMRVCAAHRAETQQALDQVLRTMIMRRDAEKVVRQAGQPAGTAIGRRPS